MKHAFRVLQILELGGEMDGVVFCDYSIPNFSCKPESQFYKQVGFIFHNVPPTAEIGMFSLRH